MHIRLPFELEFYYCYGIAFEIDFQLHAWHGNDNDNCTD